MNLIPLAWSNSLAGFQKIAAASESQIRPNQPLTLVGDQIRPLYFQGVQINHVTYASEQLNCQAMVAAFRAAIRKKMGLSFLAASDDFSFCFFSSEAEAEAMQHGLRQRDIKQVFDAIDQALPEAIESLDEDAENPDALPIGDIVNNNEMGHAIIGDQNPVITESMPPLRSYEDLWGRIEPYQHVIDAVPYQVVLTDRVNFYTVNMNEATLAGRNDVAQHYAAARNAAQTAVRYRACGQQAIDDGNQLAFIYWMTAINSQLSAAEYSLKAAQATYQNDIELAAYWRSTADFQSTAAEYKACAAQATMDKNPILTAHIVAAAKLQLNAARYAARAAKAKADNKVLAKRWLAAAECAGYAAKAKADIDMDIAIVNRRATAVEYAVHSAEAKVRGKSLASAWWALATWVAYYL